MPRKDISGPMMDWVFEELRYKAKLFEDIGAVSIYTGHVVKSDSVIPESLKHELQAAVAQLENVPDKHKDWHPGSNGKVLDLVHPSLYPLVYGRTRVLETGTTSLEECIARCGEGQTTQIPSEDETTQKANIAYSYGYVLNSYSRKFQWLPCMVDISGEHCKYVCCNYPGSKKIKRLPSPGSRVTSTTFTHSNTKVFIDSLSA